MQGPNTLSGFDFDGAMKDIDISREAVAGPVSSVKPMKLVLEDAAFTLHGEVGRTICSPIAGK